MTKETVVNVLYIAGVGRSGSTLLGDVLGMLPGVLHIGELRGVYDYTTIPDGMMPCNCGQPYEQCSFWNPIFQSLYGRDWPTAFQEREIERNLPRSVTLPWLALRLYLRNDIAISPTLRTTFRQLAALLHHLSENTPASIIIDSSKSGSFGWLLSRQCSVRVVAIHLVRDPRATIFSWLRRPIPLLEREPDGKWYAVLRTLSLRHAMPHWIRSEGSVWLMRLLGVPCMRVRYESFIHRPAESISQIAAFMRQQGLPLGDELTLVSGLNKGQVVLGTRHLIGSNPGVKSQAGSINLKEDKAWLRETPRLTRFLWTITFLPWLLWYGYDLWPRD